MSRMFYHTMQDQMGNLLFDVYGTMRLAGTGTLATIYGDEALTVVLPNPLTNHPTFGTFKFFMGVGDYDFYMTKEGYTFETLTGIQGYGTMAQQNADAVAISGGTVTASTVSTTGALSVGTTLSVFGAGTVAGLLTCTAGLTVGGTLQANNNVNIGGTLGVGGTTTYASLVTATAGLTVGGTLNANNQMNVGGNLSVTGTSSLGGLVTAIGGLTVGGTLTANNTVSILGTLGVGGSVTMSGLLHVGTDLTVFGKAGFGIDPSPAYSLRTFGDASIGATLTVGVDLGVNRDGFISRNFNVAGTASKPGGGSWADSSGRALKRNIAPIDDALGLLLAQQGRVYEWTEPTRAARLPGPRYGLIAEEVTLAQWREVQEDGAVFIAVQGFEGLCIEALRTLHTRLSALEG